MPPLPDTFEALRDAFVPEAALDQRLVVTALTALSRALLPRVPTATPRVIEGLTALDRWIRDEPGAMDEVRAHREALLADALAGRRSPTEEAELLEAMVLGTLTLAIWEDQADWPEEVVEPAITLLSRLGAPPADAAREVARALAAHGLLG